MKIWAILSADKLTDRIRSLLDKGEFSQASSIHYSVLGFTEMIEKHLQKEAGSIFCFVPDRIVIECSVEMAEQIPLFVDGYKEQTNTSIACGVGLSFLEASKALIKSRNTNKIEMYDPEVFNKSDNFDMELPINDTDPAVHEFKDNKKAKDERKLVAGPSVEDELKLQTQYLAQLVQQFSGGQPPPQQEQAAQQAQPQEQAQDGQSPQKSLYEQLLGSPAPQASKDAEQSEPEVEKKAEPEEGMTPEDKNHLDQIGEGLTNIKAQIPQLMDLADRNPAAFKQAMNLIQKMLALAGKKVNKAEELPADLKKAIEDAISNDSIYPVGTVKSRRKKIANNNRASWRGVASGMLKDAQGNAISVKSSNAQTQPDDDLPAR